MPRGDAAVRVDWRLRCLAHPLVLDPTMRVMVVYLFVAGCAVTAGTIR
jgi:hypothetical protein